MASPWRTWGWSLRAMRFFRIEDWRVTLTAREGFSSELRRWESRGVLEVISHMLLLLTLLILAIFFFSLGDAGFSMCTPVIGSNSSSKFYFLIFSLNSCKCFCKSMLFIFSEGSCFILSTFIMYSFVLPDLKD